MALDKDTERMMGLAHDARLVNMNSDMIFPLLDRQINTALDQLCNDHLKGMPPNAMLVATIAACRNIKIELNSIAQRGNAAVVKLHKQGVLE